MTKFTVHIRREMRLVFDGIEADTHDTAAFLSAEKPSGDADAIDDCDGETFSALVDVAGDEDYEQSRTIDFGPERQRKLAPKALAACRAAYFQFEHNGDECDSDRHVLDQLKAVITTAGSASIDDQPGDPAAILRKIREAAEEYDEMGRDFPLHHLLDIFSTAKATTPDSEAPTIHIEVRGGVVQHVSNMPPGWVYEIIDHDNAE